MSKKEGIFKGARMSPSTPSADMASILPAEPTKPIDDLIWDALLENISTPGLIGPDEAKQHKNVKALVTADRKQLLDRVEKIVGPNYSNWGELETEEQRVESAKNELKNEQRTALAKLRKELGL